MRGSLVPTLLFGWLVLIALAILPFDIDWWSQKQDWGFQALEKEEYRNAEQWLSAAYKEAIREGARDYDIGDVLGDLGEVHEKLKDYSKAEAAYLKGLMLLEQDCHVNDTLITYHLSRLGRFYMARGRFKEAEPYFKRALSIDEAALPALDSTVANDYSDLGVLYLNMRRLDEAEPFLRRSYNIDKQIYKPGDPSLEHSIGSLKTLETLRKSMVKIRK